MELLVPGLTRERILKSCKRSFLGVGVYAASIGLAFVSPVSCFAVYALVSVYFAWGPSSRILITDAGQEAAQETTAEEAATAEAAR